MLSSPLSVLRLSALLSLPTAILAATGFDCSDIVQDGVHFNFEKLGGPLIVQNVIDEGVSVKNQTFTLDLCAQLKKLKGVPEDEQCKHGTRICNVDYLYANGTGKPIVERAFPIAGDFIHEGRGWDPKWSRLRESGSHSDADREGLLIEFDGGMNHQKVKQKALIEMVCDHDRTGLEGDEQDDRPTEDDDKEKRDDKEEGDDDKKAAPKGKSLTFFKYEQEEDIGTLRLIWKTKYACERDTGDDSDAPKKASWGFFTWFLIILFLAISTYLIFGSWLNYNRYGARGWDLLPHGDTIRDIPYLVKDWGRKVVNTVQGGGSRGGYSAVSL